MTSATLTAEEFAQLLGVASCTLYQSVQDGSCPIEPIRVGRRLVWSRSRVATLLGVESLQTVTTASTDGQDDDALRLGGPT